MRRLVGCLCIAVATLTAPPAAMAGASAVVATSGGKVEGRIDHGAYAFLGIPYGADTSGQNRFMPPQPAPAWSGVRPAKTFGDRCPQPSLKAAAGAAPKVIQFSDLPISEDCLSLNVWTPRPGAGHRAVMVWIHGGAFSFGSASDKYYDGANLARTQNVVVISVNHRLNAFGFLDLGPEAGPTYAKSADVGLLDIVQALQWVKHNAVAFGGDAGNVTLFGQSGGGGKISTLLAMPSAHGLFQKAIIESGADLRANLPAQSIAVRDKLLAALNLKPDEVLKLRDMPLRDLVDAIAKAGLLNYHPTVDGDVLPTQMFDPAATPVSANVPLLIGNAKTEATDVLLADPSWPATTQAKLDMLAPLLVGGADKGRQAVALYQSLSPGDKPMYILSSIVTDEMFTKNTIALEDRKSVQPAPVYAYRIDWRTPVMGGMLRSPHGVELPFVFDNVDLAPELVGSGPEQDAMATLMSSMFAAFARTGDPNVKGYPHWPAYDAVKRRTFIFDIPPKVIADPNAAVRGLLGKP